MTGSRSIRLADARLLVDDPEAMVAFYRDAIGFPVRVRTATGDYAEFESGEATLSLYRRSLMEGVLGEEARRGDPGPDAVALVMRCDDVDAEYRRLSESGVAFATEPHDQSTWGLRVAHLRDPEGNLVELYTPLEPDRT